MRDMRRKRNALSTVLKARITHEVEKRVQPSVPELWGPGKMSPLLGTHGLAWFPQPGAVSALI